MNTGIRRKIGIVLGHSIPEGGWEVVFKTLEREGRMDLAKVWKVLIVVLQELERYEQQQSKENLPTNTSL